jgi:histone H3/H4
MKIALPETANIRQEAKECMQECVSEFISFITSEGTVASYTYQIKTSLIGQLRIFA